MNFLRYAWIYSFKNAMVVVETWSNNVLVPPWANWDNKWALFYCTQCSVCFLHLRLTIYENITQFIAWLYVNPRVRKAKLRYQQWLSEASFHLLALKLLEYLSRLPKCFSLIGKKRKTWQSTVQYRPILIIELHFLLLCTQKSIFHFFNLEENETILLILQTVWDNKKS